MVAGSSTSISKGSGNRKILGLAWAFETLRTPPVIHFLQQGHTTSSATAWRLRSRAILIHISTGSTWRDQLGTWGVARRWILSHSFKEKLLKRITPSTGISVRLCNSCNCSDGGEVGIAQVDSLITVQFSLSPFSIITISGIVQLCGRPNSPVTNW